jgi:hypothetical protein
MRAIRYDQLQRLLARLSTYETSDPHRLSVSRTSQIIRRWAQAKYVVYRVVYARQPGWIHLTRKGMYHAGLAYRAEPPKDRLLAHIYSINEVRLKLEEETEGAAPATHPGWDCSERGRADRHRSTAISPITAGG